jgi:leucyl-tRNA synthetase
VPPPANQSPSGSEGPSSVPSPPSHVPTLNPRISTQGDPGLERLLHKTIKKVTEDIEHFGYNTAIAQMIVWVNEAAKVDALGRDQLERFLLLLSPFAPHICEELWQRLGHTESLARAPWPTYDDALTRDETVELAVQVNGKLRARITVSADATDDQIVTAAKASPAVAKDLAAKPLRRTIVVRGRLVNLIL